MTRRTAAAVAAAMLSGALLVTGCGGKGGAGGATAALGAGGGASAAPAAKTSAAVVAIEPKDGATDVAPGALKVSVAGGRLTKVTVTDATGTPVDGTLAADGLGWVPANGLAVGTAYRVSAEAADAGGLTTTATSAFTTLTPERTIGADDNVVTGNTFGVGMIVSVQFKGEVKDRAAAAKAVTVEASDGTVVKGHWFPGNRLDLRPETFWKPGTTVKVHFRTKNVELSPGVYGATDRDEQFTIGRSKISEVDAAAHRMVVKKDGSPDQAIPITAGADDNPSWNGTMVISEMHLMEHMKSEGVPGLKGKPYTADDPHAMRLTATGTYVHGNPSAGPAVGRSNISHGCIGLVDTAAGDPNSTAGRFYADSMIGDVVKVRGSIKKEALAPDNGLSGWNIDWAQW
ncbi:Ig-like domain-containing protein [Kitasatospora sp. NPDC048540]|uniref:L,D-transpeptidase n=1 Tax=unclassified Kitasatospora TaxID=2633591 RepID=UPI00053B4240|nr:Ig-like domain-containing protein [Kitasatospora sp. MBT63]